MADWTPEYVDMLFDKIKKWSVAIIVIIVMCCASQTVQEQKSTPEGVAIRFIDAILTADAETYVSLMSDEYYYEQAVEQGFATKKIFTEYMNDELDDLIEKCKVEYGKKWDYSIEVVDSYAATPKDDSGVAPGNYMVVVLKVNHTGKILWVDQEGSEHVSLVLVEQDGGWYVCYTENTY